MRSSGDVHSAVGPVREVHAELVVDSPIVLRVGAGEYGDEVLELAHDGLDLGAGVLACGGFPPELALDAPPLSLDFGHPTGDAVQ